MGLGSEHRVLTFPPGGAGGAGEGGERMCREADPGQG
jgi:hypothetical protein